MKSARINLNVLKAVSLFVSKEETRYYLNGVSLEFFADRVIYAATDGHRLFVYNDVLPEDEERNTLTGSTLIVPFAHCVPFKATARELARDPFARIEGDGTIAPHTFRWTNSALEFKPIDGTFPDFRRVMPPRDARNLDPTPGEICFNWDYMASFQKAGEILLDARTHGAKCSIIPNGTGGPAWVSWGPDRPFYGVIMPIRGMAGTRFNHATGKHEPPNVAEAMPCVDWLDARQEQPLQAAAE